MTEEDAAVEDMIASQAAVDDAIIGDKVAADRAVYRRVRRSEGRVDALPWEERYRDLDAAVLFTSIMAGSMATLLIDPSLMPVTLPVSIAVGLLASLRRRGRRRRPRRILPEVDEGD